MKSKAIIGISGSMLLDKDEMFLGYEKACVSNDYVNAVVKNGGIPFIIPMNSEREIVEEQVKNIDALILSGGHDVNPHLYGEEPKLQLDEFYPERDEFDFMLIEYAKKFKKPILAICRGLQILNVYEGGSLYQDLSYIKTGKEILRHCQPSKPDLKTHSVIIDKNSKLYNIFGEEKVLVNSFHHQAINILANGYKVVARSMDGIIEAIESTTENFILGLQWHPEMLHRKCKQNSNIFKRLIEEARKN